IVPLSLSQDVGGPLARSVADVAAVLDATVGPDPADPVTSRGVGHIPGSYASALDRDGLRNARLGILLPLFGTAPEDQRAGSVVRTAVREMQNGGARTTDVDILDFPAEG